MSNFAVFPKGIEFSDWASEIRQTITSIDFPIPLQNSLWRDWAFQLFIMNPKEMSSVPYPDELSFPKDSDWSKWASFFVYNLTAK